MVAKSWAYCIKYCGGEGNIKCEQTQLSSWVFHKFNIYLIWQKKKHKGEINIRQEVKWSDIVKH